MDDEENRSHVGKTMEENEAYDIPGNTPHNIKRVCYPQNLCCRAVFPIVDPPTPEKPCYIGAFPRVRVLPHIFGSDFIKSIKGNTIMI